MSLETPLCRNCAYPNASENQVCAMCGAPVTHAESQIPNINDVSLSTLSQSEGQRLDGADERPTRVDIISAGDAPPERIPTKQTPSAWRSSANVRRIRAGTSVRLAPRERGFAALIASIVLFVLAFQRLWSTSTSQGSSATAAPQPVSSSNSVVIITKTRTIAVSVLERGVSFSQPQEAVPLTDGDVVVADTGNHRVVLLNPRGRVVRAITAGASRFLEPYAIAASSVGFYVLDSQRRTIESFDLRGRFRAQIFSSGVLDHPRGLALGPHGVLYVADPASNSVDAITIHGVLIRKTVTVKGSAGGLFHQPSDVAVASDGNLYTVDNTADRILALTPDGHIVDTWAAPPSSTQFSSHVLPLSDGRLLISDPTGALILYAPGGRTATRIVLRVPHAGASPSSPLGIALTVAGKVLVTDNSHGEVLTVSLPRR